MKTSKLTERGLKKPEAMPYEKKGIKGCRLLKRALAAIMCAVMLLGIGPFTNSLTTVTSHAESVYTKQQISNFRKQIYDYMKSMATIEWTASKDYNIKTSQTTYKIKKGWKMYGIPYNSLGNCKYSDIQGIKKKFTVKDGVNYLGEDVGHNDCSTAISLCYYWIIADYSTAGCSQARYYPWKYSDFVPVGSYTVGSSLSSTLKASGNKSKIYDAYSKVKKGDILVNGGHAMMVKSVNKDTKKIKLIDQSGALYFWYNYDGSKYVNYGHSDSKPSKAPSGSRRSTWNIDHNVSFDTLWKDGYIPVQYYRFKAEESAPTITLNSAMAENGIKFEATISKNLQILKRSIVFTKNKKLINKDFTVEKNRQKAIDEKSYKKFYDNTNGEKSNTASITMKNLDPMETYYFKILFKTNKGWLSSEVGIYEPAITTTVIEIIDNDSTLLVEEGIPTQPYDEGELYEIGY